MAPSIELSQLRMLEPLASLPASSSLWVSAWQSLPWHVTVLLLMLEA